MNAVFADTFYWIALTNPLDAAYDRAQEFKNDVVTTEEVLTEYLNYFGDGPAHLRRKAGLIVETVLQDPTVRLVRQSRESFRAGLTLYRARPDKGYSLTDCISMQTMRREGLTEALTNDRHFEQEGFRALFRAEGCRKNGHFRFVFKPYNWDGPSMPSLVLELQRRGGSVMTDIDWSGCPIVERDPEKMGGVPTVRAWRLSADSVVENHDDGLTPEEAADMFEAPIEDVRTILVYAEQARHSAHPVRDAL